MGAPDNSGFATDGSAGNISRGGFDVSALFKNINDSVEAAKTKIAAIKGDGDAISIADMFEMQMLMNHLSQLSEMTTGVVQASNSAIGSMARNVKG